MVSTTANCNQGSPHAAWELYHSLGGVLAWEYKYTHSYMYIQGLQIHSDVTFQYFCMSKEHPLFIVTPSPSNGFIHSELQPRQSSHCLRTVPLLGRGSSMSIQVFTYTSTCTCTCISKDCRFRLQIHSNVKFQYFYVLKEHPLYIVTPFPV